MSKVISFRLNPENPREAKALTILDDWLSQGFSSRHTITEALLTLDTRKPQTPDKEILNNLAHKIEELLERVETVSSHKIMKEYISSEKELSDGFVTSVLRGAKPGLKM
jgi:hypothetical protein